MKNHNTGRHANKMEEKKVTGKLPYEKAEMEVIETSENPIFVESNNSGGECD